MDLLIKNKRPPRCCGICLAEYNFTCGLTDEPMPNNPKFYQYKRIPIENMKEGRPSWCPLLESRKINRIFMRIIKRKEKNNGKISD